MEILKNLFFAFEELIDTGIFFFLVFDAPMLSPTSDTTHTIWIYFAFLKF